MIKHPYSRKRACTIVRNAVACAAGLLVCVLITSHVQLENLSHLTTTLQHHEEGTRQPELLRGGSRATTADGRHAARETGREAAGEAAVQHAMDVQAYRSAQALRPPQPVCEGHQGIRYAGKPLPPSQAALKAQDSAGCCQACATLPGCSLWSWCTRPGKCPLAAGSSARCVLSATDNPIQPRVEEASAEVPWLSGLRVLDSDLDALFAARGLEVQRAGHLLLGLNARTLTLDVLAPRAEPWFSFSIPQDLAILNTSLSGFHHLGDISVHLRPADTSSSSSSSNSSKGGLSQSGAGGVGSMGGASGGSFWRVSTVAPVGFGPEDQKAPPRPRRLQGGPAKLPCPGCRVAGYADLGPQLLPRPRDVREHSLAGALRITRWFEVADASNAASPAADASHTARHLKQGVSRGGPAEPGTRREGLGEGEQEGEWGSLRMLAREGEARMYFEVQHTGEGEQGGVEVGALGLSLPFDAFFDKRSLEQVAVQCSFSEAYVGGPLGYLTVTRANGAGPVLLVLPTEDSEMSFEAWRPLRHYDKTPCGFGFEGHHEVLVLSKAVAEQDWPEAQPWNPGTSRLLLPGQSLVVGLRFVLAAGPEQVEDALLAAGHPVALAVPGWLLHADQEDGRLVLKLPPGLALAALQPHPPHSIRLTQVPLVGVDADTYSHAPHPDWDDSGGARYRSAPADRPIHLTMPAQGFKPWWQQQEKQRERQQGQQEQQQGQQEQGQQGQQQQGQGSSDVHGDPEPPPGITVLSFRMVAGPGEGGGQGGGLGCMDPAAWVACPLYHQPGSSSSSSRGSSSSSSREGAHSGRGFVKQAGSSCPRFVGRVRLALHFDRRSPAPGPVPPPARQQVEQWVHLMALPPARVLVRAWGLNSAHPDHGWMAAGRGPNGSDPWGRAPAFMGYDSSSRRRLEWEPRVFMAGLSDEAGAAQPLAVAAKQLGAPSLDQVSKLEEYVHLTLYTPAGGDPKLHLQDHDTHAIRASLLFNSSLPQYQQAMPDFIASCNAQRPFWLVCWDEQRAAETWRAYNYPHVAAVYWSLYRLARIANLTTRAAWPFYLQQAVQTFKAMWQFGKGYGRWGLMVGSVFAHIYQDVVWEGWQQEQLALDQIIQERVAFWRSRTFPFASEMAWDNTGHEEIYSWLQTLNDTQGMEATVQAVLAYQSTQPHWAVAGSARRWWDFWINGASNIGNERVFHHYAAALNAIPLAQHFLRHPARLYLLRVASAGTGGSLSNIHPHGGASMGLHGDPSSLQLDAYSADFGIGFYGHCMEAGATLACDDVMGWMCFNCDLGQVSTTAAPKSHPPLTSTVQADSVFGACHRLAQADVVPRDAWRRRLFLAPLALLFTVDNAWLARAELHLGVKTVRLHLTRHTYESSSRNVSSNAVQHGHAILTVRRTAPTGSHGVAANPPLRVACEGPPSFASSDRPRLLVARTRKLGGASSMTVTGGCELAPHRGPDAVSVTLRRELITVDVSWE